MFASLVIGLREALEAAIIIGIIIAYLVKTNNQQYLKHIWSGLITAVILSVIGAILFEELAGGFTGKAEAIFEGTAMILAAGILTYMVVWLRRQKIKGFKDKVQKHLSSGQVFGLFFLSFISVFREGIETVLFLAAARMNGETYGLLGAIIGIAIAIIVGYLLYRGSEKLNISKFFTITSILLLVFAAGLLAHGIHEFQEAEVVPIIKEHIWDINPELNADGSYPILHEKGIIGGILRGLVGYNGNPNLLEVIVWIAYLGVMGTIYYKKKY